VALSKTNRKKKTSRRASVTTSHRKPQANARHAGAHHARAHRANSHAAVPAFDRTRAVIFDVEGTLVDSGFPTLLCWQEILRDYQFHFSTAELHHFSGLGSDDMLSCLLPADVAAATRKEMASRQEELYKAKYLPTVTILPGIPALIERLKAADIRVALATTSDRELLDHYLNIAGCTADLFDALACGSDADRTKPDPQLLHIALRRLSMRASPRTLGVGDTPYDAEAALACGLVPVGVLTGYFSRPDLIAAGCSAVCKDAAALALLLDLPEAKTRSEAGKPLRQDQLTGARAPSSAHQ
jgi:phosphoglycolate phosphatase-like HAD superfamily hydrolase